MNISNKLQVTRFSQTEMREHALSLLLTEKDQISFSFDKKPFKSASFVYIFYDCNVIEGILAPTKMSLSDFPSCKMQSVAG